MDFTLGLALGGLLMWIARYLDNLKEAIDSNEIKELKKELLRLQIKELKK